MSKYTVRPAARAEIPAIINIAIQSQADDPILNHIFPEWPRISKKPLPHHPDIYQWYVQRATLYYDSGRMGFYVAWFNDQMVGFAAFKLAVEETSGTVKNGLAADRDQLSLVLPPGLSKSALEKVLKKTDKLDESLGSGMDHMRTLVSMGVLHGYRRSKIGQRLLTQCTKAAKTSNRIIAIKCSDAVAGFFEDHGFVKLSSIQMLGTRYWSMFKKPM